MRKIPNPTIRRFLAGASMVAISTASMNAYAQTAGDQDEASDSEIDEIVVTGIRSSLEKSADIKRNSKSIVDAISAEDIGKFPDSNLAESLQRVTGVSVDRSLGEGSSVTVRGFGADYNLVTLNGRMMPTSTLGDGASAPSSRSYDFGNIASENIAGVDVYKTSRPHVASGGIGATINIRTTRPLDADDLVATVGVKGVYDRSSIRDAEVTPEISGLYSRKFADDTIGIAVSGSYQNRKGGVTQANVGWQNGVNYDPAFDNEWGAIPADPNAWNYGSQVVENRPDAGAAYAVPQNGEYELADFERTRLNGQVVLQYEPAENIRATVDYTYAENAVEVDKSTAGIWFNYNFNLSSWTPGDVSGPLYFTDPTVSDLSYSGALTENKSVNKSLGFNVEWDVSDRLSLEADFHDSSAESAPDNKYGSSMALGTAVFGITSQTINFENDLPVLSFESDPANDPEDPANRFATGSSFRNALMTSDVQQLQLKGSYEFGGDFIDSIDFGASTSTNEIRSAYGFIQTDSWGGLGTAADIPDDIFEFFSIPDRFDGASGSDDPNIMQGMLRFDAGALADLLEDSFGICSTPWTGSVIEEGTCLAEYTTDRRIEEETLSAFLQVNTSFEWFERDANLILGARYEQTDVTSAALTPTYTSAIWTGANEFNLVASGESDFFTVTGDYDYILPSVYFDTQPWENTKFRAAYSHTITRPTYNNLEAGLSLATQFAVDGGDGGLGNPGLEPNLSKNFDASMEWYYNDASFVSVGYYHKSVENFIGNGQTTITLPGIYHPGLGSFVDAARAALGDTATQADIRQYIIDNNPETLDTNGNPEGQATSPLVEFDVGIPVASDQTLEMSGWEFAVQHMFGETGFGVIANYTMASGDFEYDNTLSYREQQFALPGLSDSANLIGFYDKNGLQARVAYNWRDEFLAGSGVNPFYTEEYGQVDANISYEIRDGLTIFAEGIDITDADRRGHRRHENIVTFYNAQQGRYSVGARYKF